MNNLMTALPAPALFDLLDISGDQRLDAEEIYAVRAWMATEGRLAAIIETTDFSSEDLADLLSQIIDHQESSEASNPAGIVPVSNVANPTVPPAIREMINGFMKTYAHAVPFVREYFAARVAALRTDGLTRNQCAETKDFARAVDQQAGFVTGDFAVIEILDGERGLCFSEFMWANAFHRFGDNVPSRPILTAAPSAEATLIAERARATVSAPLTLPGLVCALDGLVSSPTGALLVQRLMRQPRGQSLRFAVMSENDMHSFGDGASALYDSATNTIKIRPDAFDSDDRMQKSIPVLGHEIFHAMLSAEQPEKPKTVTEEEMAMNIAWLISAELGSRTPFISAGNIYSDAARWQASWNAYSPYTYTIDTTADAVCARESSLAVGAWHQYIEQQTAAVLAAGIASMR